jgi:hypothetical protein
MGKDWNLYRYTQNTPTNATDPSGLVIHNPRHDHLFHLDRDGFESEVYFANFQSGLHGVGSAFLRAMKLIEKARRLLEMYPCELKILTRVNVSLEFLKKDENIAFYIEKLRELSRLFHTPGYRFRVQSTNRWYSGGGNSNATDRQAGMVAFTLGTDSTTVTIGWTIHVYNEVVFNPNPGGQTHTFVHELGRWANIVGGSRSSDTMNIHNWDTLVELFASSIIETQLEDLHKSNACQRGSPEEPTRDILKSLGHGAGIPFFRE